MNKLLIEAEKRGFKSRAKYLSPDMKLERIVKGDLHCHECNDLIYDDDNYCIYIDGVWGEVLTRIGEIHKLTDNEIDIYITVDFEAQKVIVNDYHVKPITLEQYAEAKEFGKSILKNYLDGI